MREKKLVAVSKEEMAAAKRFHETVTDDGTYDIPKMMLRRLHALRLIKHVGGGIYRETDLLLDLID